MKRFLFFPQNETHVQNLLPVAKRIEDSGAEVVWFNASDIFKQYIFKELPELKQIVPNTIPAVSFYRMGAKEQLKFIGEFRKYLKANPIKGFDALIISNDGALQRAVYAHMRPVKLFYILDAIITDNTFSLFDALKHSEHKGHDIRDYIKLKTKLSMMRLFRYLPFNYYFPSEIGTVKADKMFVMSDYVREILQTRGLSKKDIVVSGLPRFAPIFSKYRRTEPQLRTGKLRLMLLTQSPAWHGDQLLAEIQLVHLHDVLKTIDEYRRENQLDLELVLKIHPRDKAEAWDKYFQEFPFMVRPEKPLYEELQNVDSVLAASSTVLVESMALGCRIGVIMMMGRYWRYKRSFVSHPEIPKFETREALHKYLGELVASKERTEMPKEVVEHFISFDCEKADETIANEIMASF